MAREIAYIALGSNLYEPEKQLRNAIESMDSLASIRVTKQSSLYRSPPMGPQDQPDYINAVVQIETDNAPMDLLQALKKIERGFGRPNTQRRWGERIIDLDILLYGQLQYHSDRLIIPHAGLARRAFVLIPLAEIDDTLCIPGAGPILSLIEALDSQAVNSLEMI